MRVVIATDSFKGSLSSLEVAQAVERALLSAIPGVQVSIVPMADGGEGTVEALAHTVPGCWVTCHAAAPLPGLPEVDARYWLCSEGSTALIEVAEASGLTLVPHHVRDVMHASTLGTGQVVADALERGCRHIVLGLGGSATCDAGMGIMAALGVEFLDEDGLLLMPCGESLGKVARIDAEGVGLEARALSFTLLSDVNAPLAGPQGAACVFAPQKGATPEQVHRLDDGLRRFARVAGCRCVQRPGMGAAGGIAMGLSALWPCELLPGCDYILRQAHFEQLLEDCDLVVTGEGRLDAQTLMGKAPAAVLRAAQRHKVPVLAVCGSMDEQTPMACMPFAAVCRATPSGMPLQQALQPSVARRNIEAAVVSWLSHRTPARE